MKYDNEVTSLKQLQARAARAALEDVWAAREERAALAARATLDEALAARATLDATRAALDEARASLKEAWAQWDAELAANKEE